MPSSRPRSLKTADWTKLNEAQHVALMEERPEYERVQWYNEQSAATQEEIDEAMRPSQRVRWQSMIQRHAQGREQATQAQRSTRKVTYNPSSRPPSQPILGQSIGNNDRTHYEGMVPDGSKPYERTKGRASTATKLDGSQTKQSQQGSQQGNQQGSQQIIRQITHNDSSRPPNSNAVKSIGNNERTQYEGMVPDTNKPYERTKGGKSLATIISKLSDKVKSAVKGGHPESEQEDREQEGPSTNDPPSAEPHTGQGQNNPSANKQSSKNKMPSSKQQSDRHGQQNQDYEGEPEPRTADSGRTHDSQYPNPPNSNRSSQRGGGDPANSRDSQYPNPPNSHRSSQNGNNQFPKPPSSNRSSQNGGNNGDPRSARGTGSSGKFFLSLSPCCWPNSHAYL